MTVTRKKPSGIFICIEGIDGSGKTTQAHRLVDTLTRLGYNTIYTTEPSKGVYGEIIKKNILHRDNRVPPIVEAALFAADRLDHVQKEIKPLLESGRIVVCDRYVYSSIAYQGAAGLDIEWIKEINRNAVKPHLAVYIDATPEIVFQRIKRIKSVMETPQIQRKVRRFYLKMVEKEQLITIAGDTSVEEVAKTMEDVVLKFLKTR